MRVLTLGVITSRMSVCVLNSWLETLNSASIPSGITKKSVFCIHPRGKDGLPSMTTLTLFSLAQIQRLTDSSAHPLLNSLSTAGESFTFGELVETSGVDAEIVRLAIDAGLIRPTRTGGEAFGPETLSMLKAGMGLLDAGVPFDQLIQLAVRHADHVERVAKDAVALFADQLSGEEDSSQAETVENIIPVVTELVAQHFRQTLIEQVTRHLLAEDIQT